MYNIYIYIYISNLRDQVEEKELKKGGEWDENNLCQIDGLHQGPLCL